MNIKKMITVGVAGMAMGAMALDNVEVTDVKARQRYPWNGKVDIDFTLDSKATEPYQMQVEVYDNIGKTNLPVKSVCTEGVSVEANPCMVRTDTRRIVWDAAKDLPDGFKCTNVLVTCQDARLLSVSNLYCVIDLATGEKEYLSGVPAGGWTDEHKTTKMVFRRIEAGSFMMGSPDSEEYRESSETLHVESISSPYYISVFELTQGQYSSTSSTLSQLLTRDATDTYISNFRSKTGIVGAGLPTEAQWENACRAGTLTSLYTGYACTDANVSMIARYEGNKDDGKGDASAKWQTKVGCYLPNAFGLFDMIGNAREWCQGEVVKGGGVYYNTYEGGGTHYEEFVFTALATLRSAWKGYGIGALYGKKTYEGVRLVFPAE